MGSVALLALVLVAGGGSPDGRIETQWGWYRIEAESGENPDAEISIVVDEEAPPGEPAAVEVQGGPDESCPVPAQPNAGEGAERVVVVDCEAVRGRYLQRILELYGVSAFSLQADELGAWTHRRPTGGTTTAYGTGAGGALTDPALAPLYGEPPVPPGALSFDLSLQQLAKELLACQRAGPAPAPPASAAPPSPAAPPPAATPSSEEPPAAPPRPRGTPL